MRLKTIIILFYILQFTCFSQKKSCVIKGKYFIKSETKAADYIDNSYYIKRKKNKQIEVFDNGERKVIYSVKWIDEKTYVLTALKYVNPPESWNEKVGAKLKFKIIDCGEEFFMVVTIDTEKELIVYFVAE